LNQGKDVMAIPGSINSAESKGSNRLIADGATPIIDDRTFEDALMQVFGSDVLLMRSCAQYTDNREDNGLIGWQKKTITALTASPMRAEDMLGLCGNGLVEVIRNISQLEMAGFVERLRDGRYTCARPMR
jgi:DNA processing protein